MKHCHVNVQYINWENVLQNAKLEALTAVLLKILTLSLGGWWLTFRSIVWLWRILWELHGQWQ